MLKFISTILVAATLTACPAAKQKASVVKESYSACAVAKGQDVVNNGANIFAEVVAIIMLGNIDWQAQLERVALETSDALVECAIESLQASLKVPSNGAARFTEDSTAVRANLARAMFVAKRS